MQIRKDNNEIIENHGFEKMPKCLLEYFLNNYLSAEDHVKLLRVNRFLRTVNLPLLKKYINIDFKKDAIYFGVLGMSLDKVKLEQSYAFYMSKSYKSYFYTAFYDISLRGFHAEVLEMINEGKYFLLFPTKKEAVSYIDNNRNLYGNVAVLITSKMSEATYINHIEKTLEWVEKDGYKTNKEYDLFHTECATNYPISSILSFSFFDEKHKKYNCSNTRRISSKREMVNDFKI